MDFLLSPSSLILTIILFFVGGVGALLLERLFDDEGRFVNFWSHGFGFLGSSLALAVALSVLFQGQGIAFSFTSWLPLIEFSFRLDGLASFFLATIALIGVAASLYGYAYQKKFIGRYGEYSQGRFGFFYNAFLGSLVVVPLANHALFFLLAWEIMSLASYFLVIYEHREEENIKAGFLYFLMTHFGTGFILLAMFLAYQGTGSLSFDAWRIAGDTLAPWLQTAIFLSALIGFGTKAGIIPLHIWLPEAHPAAPSHVSALLSGVMLKTAIFMLIRFFFDFFPVTSATVEWGLVFLVLGSLSSLLGVLYALSEHDLKRLLAYHSVENIGIILLGFGAAITFFGLGLENFAVFALAAALYHTLNHAIFKALLFLGAGSVVSATGTRQMELYGGLIRVLPYTAIFFLIGSLAISAFPPLNGFASEWLTFQALFVGLSSGSLIIKAVFIFAIASLVFTGGLAAACFVKAFGTTFLARPRNEATFEEAEAHQEAPWPMLLSMGFLAVLTLLLGIGATPVIATLVAIVASIGLIDEATLTFPFQEFIQNRADFAAILPLEQTALILILVFLLISGIVILFTRKRKIIWSRTWDCGTLPTERTEITATSFSRSLVTIFRSLLRPTKEIEIVYQKQDPALKYFIASQAVQTHLENPYHKALYHPIHVTLRFLGSQARRIQSGSINLYILYVLITLIGLLIFTLR